MTNGQIIGWGIGLTLVAVGGFVLYNNFKSAVQVVDTNLPPVNTGGGTVSKGTGSVKTKTTYTQPTTEPNIYRGKKVSEVLLNTDPKLLIGMKVYSSLDGVNVYTDYNTLYTKAKNGQLLGSLSSVVANPSGGYMVSINTGNKTTPYVKALDAFLKF